jgi:hypothetical protein
MVPVGHDLVVDNNIHGQRLQICLVKLVVVVVVDSIMRMRMNLLNPKATWYSPK